MLAERFSRLRTDLNAALEAYLVAASSMEDYGMQVAQSLVDLDEVKSSAPGSLPIPSPEPPLEPPDLPHDPSPTPSTLPPPIPPLPAVDDTTSG